MAEKNTLSILESIKQKMIKFDQKSKKNDEVFEEEDDEFEYVAPSKNAVASDLEDYDEGEEILNISGNIDQKVSSMNLNNVPQVSAGSVLEEDFMEEDAEDHGDKNEEDDSGFVKKNNDNFLFTGDEKAKKQVESFLHDEHEIDLDVSDEDYEAFEEDVEQKKASEVKEDLKNNDSEEEKENFVEDDLDLDDLELEDDGDDLDLDEDTEDHDENDEEAIDLDDIDLDDIDLDEELEEQSDPKTANTTNIDLQKQNEEDLDFEDDDFLDDLHSDEKIPDNKILEQKVLQDADIQNLKPEPIKPTSQEIFLNYQNKASVIPAQEQKEQRDYSLLHSDTIVETTQSIRKLIDANNVVHGMKSFVEQGNASAFNEIAVQLMEPKLEKWLNENLSGLVEKIVREEIKKIMPKE